MPKQGQIWPPPFLEQGQATPGPSHRPQYGEIDYVNGYNTSDCVASSCVNVTVPALADDCSSSFKSSHIDTIRSRSSSQESPVDVINVQLTYGVTDTCSSSSSQENPADVHTHIQGTVPCSYQLTAYPRNPSDFLLRCNPVTVVDSIMAKVKSMISTYWPDVTESTKQTLPVFAQTYEQVKKANLPNFAGAKIPVPSGLLVENWVNLLLDYHDNELCHFLQFGWPIGYLSDKIPVSVNDNHPSALAYPTHVDDFIKTEIGFGAIEGPMSEEPFAPWTRISPLMTRPKKGTDNRRIIVDLSYPEGAAVNSGIEILQYLGCDISYSLPTVVDLITKLQQEGRGAFIWKADLARAYRQLRADPVDAPLLGIKHRNKIYVDRCPPFGCRSSSAACQRVANAIVYLLTKQQHHCLAYLDDFAGCHINHDQAQQAYTAFMTLTKHLGLQLSLSKCIPPSTCVEWLGYEIDTLAMTISIPKPKLEEVVHECHRWFGRKRVTRAMVQSLAGRLAHVAGCIRHGRKFLTRILAALRADYHKKWLTIDQDFLKDVKWFHTYARSANGVSLYSTNHPEITIECDSSLQGAGGNSSSHCYTWVYTDSHKARFKAIHQMEAVNILVSYRTLAHLNSTAPTSVLILTDNISSSAALMTGRTRDSVLGACARELWLEAAKHDDIITIQHKPGVEIPLADGLSRMAQDVTKRQFVHDTVKSRGLVFVPPVLNHYIFFDGDL